MVVQEEISKSLYELLLLPVLLGCFSAGMDSAGLRVCLEEVGEEELQILSFGICGDGFVVGGLCV